MNDKPLVSIIIPVYNGENYLRESINCALSQTYPNIEIIVVNDGSRDNGATEKIALSYKDKIRYYYKENGGVSSALNYGLKHMNGEFFSWLSHDDLYSTNKIEQEMNEIKKYSTNVIVLCKSEHIDEYGNCIKLKKRKNRLRVGINRWNEGLNDILRNGSYNGCAFLIPKHILDCTNGFDESLRFCQDVYLWIQLFLLEYDIVYIDNCCVYNRIHKQQLTHTRKDLFYKDSETISKKILPMLIKKEKYSAEFIYSYTMHNAILNNTKVVDNSMDYVSCNNLLSFSKIMKIKVAVIYGKWRPLIKKIYYSYIFRKK